MSIVKRIFLGLFVALYVFSGVRHFTDPDFYVGMMPPYIPFHLELVYLSGVIEIVLGLLAAVPRFRRLAAWAVVAMLLAFMPVHIHMALNPELYPEVPVVGLWIRIPAQGLFILWAYWFTRPERPAAAVASAAAA
jgi:uncharacterized membrane protein